jgi:hypothetical protein
MIICEFRGADGAAILVSWFRLPVVHPPVTGAEFVRMAGRVTAFAGSLVLFVLGAWPK